jgi:Xaa-Pro aminopeptidase
MTFARRRLAGLLIGLASCVRPGVDARAQAPPADEVRPAELAVSPAEFAERRRRLRELMRGEDATERPRLALLRGADVGDREDFEEGRFYQEANFHYLTGVDLPGAYVLIDATEDRDVLFLPPRHAGPDGIGSAYGFDEVAPTDHLLGRLFTRLASPPRRGWGTRPAAQLRLLAHEPRDDAPGREARFVRWLREGAPVVEYAELGSLVATLRKEKSAAEVAILQRAIDITGDAQRAAAGALRPGVHEYTLEGVIAGAFLAGGAMRAGFASIVGSGPNACIPHYFENDRGIEAGDLVVVDIGAEYRRYTADITRTYPATGRFSARQRELYQAVLDAQRHAEERFRPGETKLHEMTGWVREYFRGLPLRAKTEDGRELTLDHFFIHGLSHYLGLDVHDVGSTTEPMRAGEVFTIEPGLYIPAERIGIRIEDDYLVTEAGLEKLSKGIPSEPDAVEALVAGARGTEAAGVGR